MGRCGYIYLDKVILPNNNSYPNPNNLLVKRKRKEEEKE